MQTHQCALLQSRLYAALRRTKLIPDDTGWQELGYSRCGRTDKGVSALGQVSPSHRQCCNQWRPGEF